MPDDNKTPNRRSTVPELFAWVGEDELGSGEIGLKQAIVPAGTIPMVAIHRHKMDRDDIIQQLQVQASFFGKTIKLYRYIAVDLLKEITPEEKGGPKP